MIGTVKLISEDHKIYSYTESLFDAGASDAKTFEMFSVCTGGAQATKKEVVGSSTKSAMERQKAGQITPAEAQADAKRPFEFRRLILDKSTEATEGLSMHGLRRTTATKSRLSRRFHQRCMSSIPIFVLPVSTRAQVTRASGQTTFAPGLLRGHGAASAATILAYGGQGDFAILDLTRAAFDLSDRGVSGRPSPGSSEAFVYTERGVYRPGETVEVMALLRDRLGYNAAHAGSPLIGPSRTKGVAIRSCRKAHLRSR
jgi:hypothetical protein